jgi:hypothetical protein
LEIYLLIPVQVRHSIQRCGRTTDIHGYARQKRVGAGCFGLR